MKCPKCGEDNNYVSWTRETEQGNQRRGRKCGNCGTIFKTIECVRKEDIYEFRSTRGQIDPAGSDGNGEWV